MKTIKRLFIFSAVAFLCLLSPDVQSQTLESDSLALVDLYNDCGGSAWSGFESWLNGPLSDWKDVTVDSATQRVTHVEFSRMTLSGTLPASLGTLDKMSGKIQLNGQPGLTGELPSFVWNWVDVDRFQVKFCGYTSLDVTGMENMTKLTEFNSEGTPIAGMVPGVIFELPAMEKLYLHESEYDALPASITSISGYTRLYLNANKLTSMPDMSGVVWGDGAKVRFQDNYLDFADLEPNAGISTDALVEEFRYSPQTVMGDNAYMYPTSGDPVNLSTTIGGTANVYQWIKNGEDEVGTDAAYDIAAFDADTHSGEYFAVVNNTTVTGLTLMSPSTSLFGSSSAQDSLALVDLYNDCGGANWSGFETWLNGPISTWRDVTVDSASQRVTHVEFSRMTLTGSLPATLGGLDKMSGKIQLNGQPGLTGELPSFVWNWVDVDRFQVKFCGYTSLDVTGMENMTKLTEFNSEGTPIKGMVPGAIFELPAMEKLYLHESEYDALPASITAISGYTRLYLNANKLTSMPDMSAVVWGDGAKVRFQDNYIGFADLEPNATISDDALVEEFRYSPQSVPGEVTYLYPAAGDPVSLSTDISGTANAYQWIKDGEDEVGTDATYEITSFDPSTQSGEYFAVVNNTTVAGLTLTSPSTFIFGSKSMQDSLALVDLYNDCGGADWTGFDTWLNGPLNTWERVTVDSTSGRVTNVEFKDMHLTGTLPASLGWLDEMSGKIEFRDDSLLTGEMPSFLWNWVKVDRFQMKFAGYTSMDLTGIENMVNLTEFNTEGTPFTGMVPGAIFELPAIVKLYFHKGQFDALPAEVTQATGLDRLYVNDNMMTALPDMSGMTWGAGAKIRVQDNYLTFEDLEGNVVVASDTLVEEFRYSPQANVGEETTMMPDAGSEVTLSVEVGGTENSYIWVKGDEQVADSSSYVIASYDEITDSGVYFAQVQNTLVPGLVISSNTTTLLLSPALSDSLALVDLYNDCGGTEWSGYETWLAGPLDTWKGVTLDSTSRRVIGMDFRDMNLTGALPESLGGLDSLGGKIEFRDDTLMVGEMPAFLWNWVNVDRFQVKFGGYTSMDLTGLEKMVNLTEFNTEGTKFDGTVPGAFFTLPAMVKLYFHKGNYDAMPAEALQSSGLDRLYVNENNISELPDMSGISWGAGAKIRVQDNLLTFEDLEYNMPVATDTLVEEFRYSPQANVGEAMSMELNTGDTLNLAANIGGTENIYLWVKGENAIEGEEAATYQNDSLTVDDSGMYMARVQNTIVTGLEILTEVTTVTVLAPSGIEEVPFEGLQVLGNPVGERLSIKSNENISQISIFSVNGQLLKRQNNFSNNVNVNMTGYQSGIYFVMIQNDSKYQTIKVVKE